MNAKIIDMVNGVNNKTGFSVHQSIGRSRTPDPPYNAAHTTLLIQWKKNNNTSAALYASRNINR
jgi:beta-xylosidase